MPESIKRLATPQVSRVAFTLQKAFVLILRLSVKIKRDDAITVGKRLYILSPPDELLAELSGALKTLRAPYEHIGRACLHNLHALISTISLPWTLTASWVHNWHHTTVEMRHAMLALGFSAAAGESEEQLEERRKDYATRAAEEEWAKFASSSDGVGALSNHIMLSLFNMLEDEDLSRAASELLLQGTVLAWGGLEVLVRDVVVTYLNETPSAIERIAKDPATRRRVEMSKIPLELLSEYGYDLSRNMGNAFSQQQDFSDLNSMKSVLTSLFPKAEDLVAILSCRQMWVLSQQRHLIVHRRGMVDQQFLDKTGLALPLGARLEIEPSTLTQHIALVEKSAVALLHAVADA